MKSFSKAAVCAVAGLASLSFWARAQTPDPDPAYKLQFSLFGALDQEIQVHAGERFHIEARINPVFGFGT